MSETSTRTSPTRTATTTSAEAAAQTRTSHFSRSSREHSKNNNSNIRLLPLVGSPLKRRISNTASSAAASSSTATTAAAVVSEEKAAVDVVAASEEESSFSTSPTRFLDFGGEDDDDGDCDNVSSSFSTSSSNSPIFRRLSPALASCTSSRPSSASSSSSATPNSPPPSSSSPPSTSLPPSSSLPASSSSSSPVVAPPRRSRQYFSRLPTLDETSSSESSSFEADDRDNADMLTKATISTKPTLTTKKKKNANGNSPKRKLEWRITSLGSAAAAISTATTSTTKPLSSSTASNTIAAPTLAAGAAAATTGTSSGSSSSNSGGDTNNKRRANKTPQERVQELTEQGDDIAACGNEEKALSLYKKALKVSRIETSRIKSQLKQVDGKHPSTVQSIASRLYEDWLQVGTNIAEIRCKMAILAERVGDYDKALVCCVEAKGVYKRQLAFLERKKLEDKEVRASAKTVAKMFDKMKRARDSFATRKHLHEEIIVLRRALQFERDRGKIYSLLEEMTQRALALETEMLGRDHPQIADTLSVLATLDMEQGKIVRAELYLKEAVLITQNALGNKHPLTGEILLQMARVKASQPQMDAPTTLQYYEDALTIFRAVNPPLATQTLNEMAVIRIRQRKHEIAIDLLNQALQSSSEDQQLQLQQDSMVQIYRNLGECYLHQRDYAPASEAFVHALDKQREIRKLSEGTSAIAPAAAATEEGSPLVVLPVADDECIADTVRRLGKAYMGCGRHADALAMYGEALLIHRAAVMRVVNPTSGKPNEGLPERQDQLAHTLFCIAEARQAIGDLAEAERVYSESMQLRLFSDAHRADKRQNMIHCAMCLRGIGNVHMSRKEYEACQRVFDDALRYCEGHGLPNEHPIASSIRQKLEEAKTRSNHDSRLQELHQLEQEVKVQIADGELDNSVDTLTRIMSTRKAILKLLKATNQDATNEKIETAYTLKLFGKVLLLKGDMVNAERAFGDSLRLFKKGNEKDQAAIEEVKLLLEKLRTHALETSNVVG